MGIDLHNLNFLAHAQDLGVSFERTLAIGRQAIFVEPRLLESHRRLRGLPALVQPPAEPGRPVYFEPLLQQWLGARRADSVDASAYEGATWVHDMNLPWTADVALGAADPADAAEPIGSVYDAVLDFGCLEHVFDFPTAWRNCVDRCRVGGHVLHALPANNLAGHGFYQFSPELFANLYQPSRGFELRALYFAVKADPRCWWRVASPLAVKRRVNLRNSHEVYLLVLARKLREPGDLAAPQQSDYELAEWQGITAGAAGGGDASDLPQPSRWSAPLASLGLLDVSRRARARWQALRNVGLGMAGPDYERIDIAGVLRRPAR